MSLTKASYSMITGAPVNVKDFGATGDGTTDDTAAIQLAITYVYSFSNAISTGTAPALYFPSGTYLMSSTITMGNTGFQYTLSPYFFGDGTGTIIKVTATNVNPFFWRGPVLGQPGAGNQAAGPTIENMSFVGPGSSVATSSSIGLNFNTVQGPRLINTSCSGWYTGESYTDTDVITRINASSEFNIIGINSDTLNGLIRLDRMVNNGGSITHNTNFGIYYIGGQTPAFNNVFFNSNGTSLALSVSPPTSTCITVGAVIQGCYFEADTSNTIIIGGGLGIVRDLYILGGAVAGNSAVPLINVANYVDTTGRGFINMNLNNSGAGGIVTQASSVSKIQFQSVGASTTPSSFWGIDFAPSTTTPNFVAFTTLMTYDLASGSGLVVLHNNSNGDAGFFICFAGSVVKIAGAASVVSGVGGASQIGLEYNSGAGKYRINNGYASTQNLFITTIRTRTEV